MGKTHALLEMLGRERGPRHEVEALIAADGRRARPAGGDAPGVCAHGPGPGVALPPGRGPAARSAGAALLAAEQAVRRRVRRAVGPVALAGLRRPGPRPGVGDPARRRHLSGVDLHHVPGSSQPKARSANGAARPPIRPGSAPSWSPADRTRCGRGTSPSCKGPSKGVYYDLYVIIDIFSRYVVGWMVAPTETAELAKAFIADTINAARCHHGRVDHPRRSGHVDDLQAGRRAARRARRDPHPLPSPRVATTTRTRRPPSRPLKYCPAFPERFGSIQDARAFCAEFFEYYNHHHRHSGIALHTPASMHFGTADDVQAARSRHPRTPPTPPTPAGSATAGPPHQRCPPSPGSTSPPSPTTLRRNPDLWSQTA